ncbi:L-glutamate gamma-semialdehyde dehydrogenase [Dehalobacterium formicoaceticum]|uniref:L-glutamate gamma-semialdehyde dehydrogenase n=1 Tax=Dehalobacterium formicoaceticum TaxID=51515 RepID=A0ABT1Y3R7_9FIRM|nr:L-glutamate gamma-semialdehyde dehydrogenase [Dehalobacterium formicoaceticum]MCR6545213.1 L-glutamate gamma-semialdehyde dehydrogenase [Dehalobacterium formicoaceticum]
MRNSISKELKFKNEKVLKYLPESPERKELEAELINLKNSLVDIPVIINGKEIRTGNKGQCILPHNKNKVIGEYHKAGKKEVEMAIEAALKAKANWESLHWESRVAIFMKAAELASGKWRAKLNAATMLCQGKTYKQAEIDSACELIDFMRYNASCLHQIYSEQPISSDGIWNRTEYRPLEGFIFAVSPFNFTAIGSNLVGAPVIAGNTALWKPAAVAVYSAYLVFKLFQEAGIPDGVINFIPGNSQDIGDLILTNENLSGIHFTGSTKVFQDMWRSVGTNIDKYKTFPRLVGETGGKNFVIGHASANIEALSRGLLEGAFEYQGQKCSAASRAYIASSIWTEVKENLLEKVRNVKIGDVEDFNNFMGAVIDKKAFESITSYIEFVKNSDEAEIIIGGKYDDSIGYFIEPTIVVTNNPHLRTMEEEIFGPVLTIYVYKDEDFADTLRLCDSTSKYGLTGSIFAVDRYAIAQAENELVNAAGNFYINDRPTGAVVGQQPFGGARLSGTNDKAGSKINLMRWMSIRAIKEKLN